MTNAVDPAEARKAQVAYAYELGIRRLWFRDLSESVGEIRVYEPDQFGNLGPCLAAHPSPSLPFRIAHPFVIKAFRTAASEMLLLADMAILGKPGAGAKVYPGSLPITAERAFVDVSPGVAVLLEA